MNALRVLRAADRTAEPWRNGGGLTRPVMTCPASADANDFLWRASVATIDAPSRFSRFDGMDRRFALIQGRLLLSIESEARWLSEDDAAIAFAGEVEVAARPAGGSVLAFNLIARRGHASVEMFRSTGEAVDLMRGTTLALALERMTIDGPAGPALLEPLDALVCDRSERDRLTLPPRAIVARILTSTNCPQ
nr:HutD family protein [Sphingomonas sp. Y57]